MNFPISLFLTAGGLFDFDLTFVAEAILFLLLAFVVTFVFLGPVTKQLDERAELINYTLRKSTILLTFGYEKLSNCLELLTLEIAELNRQLKLTRAYTQSHFEEEVNLVQKENGKILSKLKGHLAIQSASILASITPDFNRFIDAFFIKKFQS